MTSSYWRDECELAARKILRRGFLIDEMRSMSTISLGREQQTDVLLVISTGSRAVYDVSHHAPGIKDGILDMAREGLDGRMILYGLAFQFIRRTDRVNSGGQRTPRTPRTPRIPHYSA
ncbi:hypothetical protein F5Y13DRAFT_191360 [Hypoxylon sp. FL1857]|nr:hypothetical protein F5Y13DRAFT_191360 [Hypoxylon sp. FL1857]